MAEIQVGSTIIPTDAESELKTVVKEVEEPTTTTTETKAEHANGNSSESSGVHEQLLRQLEYYFGDVNLPHDKFIKTELSQLEGWFPVELLLKFNKVNQILTGLSDEDKIKQIVQTIEGSALIELNEAKDKLRRNPEVPIPEGTSDRKAIYLKGFHKTETTIDQLLAHFKKYEGMEAVIMRYYKEKVLLANVPEKKTEEEVKSIDGASGTGGTDEPDNATPLKKYTPVSDKIAHVKKFKGSIYVVFKTEELAKAALDDITTYCGNDLIKMMQYEYIEKKRKEYEEREKSRKRKHDDPKKEDAEKEAQDETYEEDPQGIFVKVAGIPKDFSREKLKEFWYKTFAEDKFEVAFVDFQKGDTEGILRLSRENAGTEALETLKEKDSQFPIGDDKFVKVSGFDEESEQKYRVKVKQDRINYKRNRGRGRGGSRGGYSQRGGRGRKKPRY